MADDVLATCLTGKSPREACGLVWELSRVDEVELREALRGTCNVEYDDPGLFLRLEPLMAAVRTLVTARGKSASKDQPTRECLVQLMVSRLDASRAEIGEWLSDFRVNGTRHPELWTVAARFLTRAARGELVERIALESKAHPPFEQAKAMLVGLLSEESPVDAVWARAWKQQRDRLLA